MEVSQALKGRQQLLLWGKKKSTSPTVGGEINGLSPCQVFFFLSCWVTVLLWNTEDGLRDSSKLGAVGEGEGSRAWTLRHTFPSARNPA